MERESFEDEKIAQVLNDKFVSIKVDREERPDVDHIYMTICQAMTGEGGWPMTLLLTPDQAPLFAGTYFPKESRYGRPGLVDILTRVSEEWENRSGELANYAADLLQKVQNHFNADFSGEWDPALIDAAYDSLLHNFDDMYGGFGTAPKFPTPHTLMFLLRYSVAHANSNALDMVRVTLDGMARGGIHDHVGGGYSRYSTDRQWLVPHFEKMLYDNALLLMAYTEAYQTTTDPLYRCVVKRIITYLQRDMRHPEGAFYSAEDADSEGEEGRFYIWTPQEIVDVLGDSDGALYCDDYDITDTGNFEGRNIPNRIGRLPSTTVPTTKRMEWNDKLLARRSHRVRPHLDDKILTSWNGITIAAMAKAGRVFDEPDWIQSAVAALEFIRSRLVDPDGRLLARFRDGESRFLGYVDDYAAMVWGLVELYEATFDAEYLAVAIDWQNDMIQRFWDEELGGFYYYPHDGERLVARPKEVYDGAMPSGNSMAALNLLRLARLTGDQKFEGFASQLLRAFAKQVAEYPAGHTFFLMAMQFAAGPTHELAIVSSTLDEVDDAVRRVQAKFLPQTVVLWVGGSEAGSRIRDLVPPTTAFELRENKPTYYLCQNFACQQPTHDFLTIEHELR